MSYRLMRKAKICMELNVKTSAVGVNLMRHTFTRGARRDKVPREIAFLLVIY
jgi:hypothetical protein